MKKILSPTLPGQQRLQFMKTLDGGHVVKIGEAGVLLSPRQAYDFAVGVLKNIGIDVNEIPRRPDDLPGNVLKASIKLVG